jgi:hypothetical protein
MDAATFTALALRVISREADDAERRALEAEVAASPERQEEFVQLRMTLDVFRAVAPMSDAIVAQSPELPAYRVNELRGVVRRHFGPATEQSKAKASRGAVPVWRWLFAGSGFAAVWVAVVLFCFANRSIEIGLYGSDLVRSGDQGLSQKDIPDARLVTFDQDAPFDQWQSRPLAWNQHAKIWVDNERDLLYIVRRVKIGQVIQETEPLAPTIEGQRQQIERVVSGLKN